jgi:hypothetical protein
MKDARDSLEKKVLLGKIEDQAARENKLLELSGAPIASLEGDAGGHGDESDVEGYLEPTPLAIPDAAYAEDGSEDVNDLGVALGKIRLGERVGGLFRPKIGDEVRLRFYDSIAYVFVVPFLTLFNNIAWTVASNPIAEKSGKSDPDIPESSLHNFARQYFQV